jgi:tetratricopeptide (TPR) repeat protein
VSSLLAIALSYSLALGSAPVEDIVARAESAYLAERWEEASTAFAEAYAIDPNPVYLYARAQAERLAGRCTTALDLYDRYLESRPPDEAAHEARINRARCEVAVPKNGPPGAPEPDTATAGDRTPERPWYRDPIGGALVGVGGLSTIVGGSVLGIAIAQDARAIDSSTEGEFVDAKDRARVRHRVGIALISVGAALLVAGAVRWTLVARRRPNRRATLGPAGLGVRF